MNNILSSVLTQSYHLIVIGEDETPLAAGPAGSYYVYAVVTVVLAALIAVAALWITRRNALKRRLLDLRKRSGNTDTSVPVSIKGIREAITETEAVASADILQECVNVI
ncbi:MAG: hypothetical protein K6E19_04725 [Lachnospiraceae bacterium]|nr:hypothetical protein [Lachnospiraceae bacterium]